MKAEDEILFSDFIPKSNLSAEMVTNWIWMHDECFFFRQLNNNHDEEKPDCQYTEYKSRKRELVHQEWWLVNRGMRSST
jgi:hypothetical protein